MVFLNGILVAVSWHKLESFSCVVFYPHFPVLQNAIREQTRVFLFRGFFCKDF
jgi:hypothetical protein